MARPTDLIRNLKLITFVRVVMCSNYERETHILIAVNWLRGRAHSMKFIEMQDRLGKHVGANAYKLCVQIFRAHAKSH